MGEIAERVYELKKAAIACYDIEGMISD